MTSGTATPATRQLMLWARRRPPAPVKWPGRFGGGQLRIAIARHFVDLQQVGGMGGQRQQGSGRRPVLADRTPL